MRHRIAIQVHAVMERLFPERRIYLRSDDDVRFLRLKPWSQLLAAAGASLIVAWSIFATAILTMDAIGAGNFREQAQRDQETYEARINSLSAERDSRAHEAVAAQERFNTALNQISSIQTELLNSEARRRELETGIDVIQSTLHRTVQERDTAQEKLAQATLEQETGTPTGTTAPGDMQTVSLLANALSETATARDKISADAHDALLQADEIALQLKLMQERNDEIFEKLEDAMTISVEPLDKMFRAAGLNTKDLLQTVRKGYSGQGGPLMPLSVSTRGEAPSQDMLRANRILDKLDRLNIYRIAAEKAPFALPVKSSFRFTSGFGMRWGRMHNGVDFAGAYGTPLHSTADGTVVYAGWQSGYGRLVRIQHEFGIETRYAHLAQIRVKVGQRVSRGQLIGDMGNSGRSTGTHLHYEVRVGGRPINPMIYIKAANDVF